MTTEKIIKNIQMAVALGYPLSDEETKFLDTALHIQQEPDDWVCTLKCKALIDGGLCGHGGLCCLYESQRIIKENMPLTLDELRKMGGEPVWCSNYQCYGIVKVETCGSWANKPYLVGSRHGDFYGTAVNFEYDIESRGLTLYRSKPKENDHESCTY